MLKRGNVITTQKLSEIRKQNMIARGILTEEQIKEKSRSSDNVYKKSHEEFEKLSCIIKMNQQKEEVRSILHNKFLASRKNNVITVNDFEGLRVKREEDKNRFLLEASKVFDGVLTYSVKVGKEALHLTNEYRLKYKLSPCSWSGEIHEICRLHSEMMGLEKKGFDHRGFEERFIFYYFLFFQNTTNTI
jgi:hypothetical protein